MSTLNSSLSRSKYVVWLWLFGISSFRINGVFVLLRFATLLSLLSLSLRYVEHVAITLTLQASVKGTFVCDWFLDAVYINSVTY